MVEANEDYFVPTRILWYCIQNSNYEGIDNTYEQKNLLN